MEHPGDRKPSDSPISNQFLGTAVPALVEDGRVSVVAIQPALTQRTRSDGRNVFRSPRVNRGWKQKKDRNLKR